MENCSTTYSSRNRTHSASTTAFLKCFPPRINNKKLYEIINKIHTYIPKNKRCLTEKKNYFYKTNIVQKPEQPRVKPLNRFLEREKLFPVKPKRYKITLI